MTFVIENKGKAAVESLKLDLALFNTDGAVYRRMLIDMAPVRAQDRRQGVHRPTATARRSARCW